MDEQQNQVIRINVGGTVYKCYRETLTQFPDSKLAKLDKENDDFDIEDNEYFFDRNPVLFAYILDSYRKDGVHLPKDTCGTTFRKELAFWEISPHHVAPCCWEALYRSEEDVATVNYLNETDHLDRNSNLTLLSKGNLNLRSKLWVFLDAPRSSKPAMAWSIFISLVIVASILVDCLATVDVFQENFTSSHVQAFSSLADAFNIDNANKARIATMKPRTYLIYINAFCHTILTIELVFSFVVCQNKKKFVLCFTRLVAGFGYLSHWIAFTFYLNIENTRSVYTISVQAVFQYMSIFKLARLFYLTRSVPAFKIIRLTFRSSKQEIIMLAFLLGILVCVFGYILFAVEFVYNPNISNIFVAIYWALITLTTVGYGNYVPDTPAGHVIAGACAVCGVLVLAMPVGIIVSKFYKYYNFLEYKKQHERATAVSCKTCKCKDQKA